VNKRMAGWTWLSFLWIASVFAQQGSVEDPVLGKMGSVEIKASEIRRLIDAQPPELRKQITGASELDRLVRSELVRQSLLMEARSKGWDKKPDVALMMERARDQALLQMYVSNLARPPAEYPTEDEIRRAYEANKDALAVPAQFNLAQIFISSPADADKPTAAAAQRKAMELAVKAKASGADFAKLARENSEHADSASKGGEMGWISAAQLQSDTRSAVEKLDKGEVGGPIRTSSGWHIFKLLDRKAASMRSLSEAHDSIANQLRTRRAQEIERSYIEALISRTQPSVNQAELAKLQGAK
jgi:peptidylprolyl isomerase